MPKLIIRIALMLCLLGLALMPVAAQDDALNVQQAAEYDIGFDCPVTSALDPTSTVLWVLMDGSCFSRHHSLLGFNVADGTPVNAADDHFASAFTPLGNTFIDSETLPLVFTSATTLDLIYSEEQTYETRNVRLTLDSSPLPADSRSFLPTIANLNALIPGFEGYPETTVYNADHTLAVVTDSARFHVIDMQAGTDILQIDATPSTDGSTPYFSADGQSLYIATYNHPDDMTDYSAILSLYSLPDGKLQQTYAVPSAILYISPDGRYAAAQSSDDAFVVVELATGKTSASLPLSEAPHAVPECLNSGNDLRDLDYVTSGDLFLMDLKWLPDSSGFMTIQSYLGDGAEGSGSICIFNYSRLRRYTLAGA